MSDETKKTKQPSGRRTFLVGLATGAGAVAAVSAAPRAAATKEAPAEPAKPAEPVLYRRTEDTNRYYRSLYR